MVTYTMEAEKLICRFEDRLDTVGCLAFEKEISEKIKEGRDSVVFDLEKVPYVASSFLRICLRVCKEIEADRFSLIRVCPEVKKVFKIAGLDKHIRIE